LSRTARGVFRAPSPTALAAMLEVLGHRPQQPPTMLTPYSSTKRVIPS
jgi:hypothetical protein